MDLKVRLQSRQCSIFWSDFYYFYSFVQCNVVIFSPLYSAGCQTQFYFFYSFLYFLFNSSSKIRALIAIKDLEL